MTALRSPFVKNRLFGKTKDRKRGFLQGTYARASWGYDWKPSCSEMNQSIIYFSGYLSDAVGGSLKVQFTENHSSPSVQTSKADVGKGGAVFPAGHGSSDSVLAPDSGQVANGDAEIRFLVTNFQEASPLPTRRPVSTPHTTKQHSKTLPLGHLQTRVSTGRQWFTSEIPRCVMMC